jgi:hypothetical protein
VTGEVLGLTNFSDGVTMANNTINASEAVGGVYGIVLQSNGGIASDVVNNMIVIGGPIANSTGIYYQNFGGSANIYHNTVNMVGTSTGNTALWVENYNTNSTQGARLVNNIFHNFGQGSNGGRAIAVTGSNFTAALAVSDFNDIVTTGTVLSSFNNVNQANLAAWRGATGRDQNSVSVPVTFVGGADAHLNAIQIQLWGSATLLNSVRTDIDGDPRRKPYMGANGAAKPLCMYRRVLYAYVYRQRYAGCRRHVSVVQGWREDPEREVCNPCLQQCRSDVSRCVHLHHRGYRPHDDHYQVIRLGIDHDRPWYANDDPAVFAAGCSRWHGQPERCC